MIQLQAADVAALRCAFVHSIFSYFQCKKYSIRCNLEESKQDFLNYKLASSDCTLGETDNCRLVNAVEPSLVVTCNTEIPCTSQAAIAIKDLGSGSIYTPSLYNNQLPFEEILTTTQPYIVLLPNSIDQDAYINNTLVNENLELLGDAVISTGKAKVGVSVVTSSNYSMQAITQFGIDGHSEVVNAYIRRIRIYYTNSIGQYVPGQFWDINVSPVDSPYLACGTCTPVSPTDLFLASPN